MIELDTNFLVRYLTQDDPDQAARATRVVEQELTENMPGFIGLFVLIEPARVLQRLCWASASEIRETVTDLMGSRATVVKDRDVVDRAPALSKQNSCSFADAIIAASAFSTGCSKVTSFDGGAVNARITLVK